MRPMVKDTLRPTEAELLLLKVLWRRGPSTVREVMEEVSSTKPTGYTTVLKLMQIMTDKGLVVRDESQRTHVYKARCTEDQTQKRMVRHLLDRAYEGAASKLVLHALSSKKASKAERDEIRKLLDQMEGRQ